MANRSQPPAAGSFVTLSRSWTDGDRVDLELPMPLSTIPGVNNSVSLSRGPLVFSLKMPEHKTPVKPDSNGFVPLEITSPDPWNFALNVDPAHVAGAVQVRHCTLARRQPLSAGRQPGDAERFRQASASWGMNWTGRSAEDPPVSPVSSDQPEQTVTLVPFGAQTLRVTAFPWLGEPAAPAVRISLRFPATAMHPVG